MVATSARAASRTASHSAASKCTGEHLMRSYACCYGLQCVSLRYFNAAGASFDSRIGEDWTYALNLIPVAIRALLTDGARLADERDHLERRLEVGGADVLAAGGDDQLLLAVDDLEVAVLVEFADVAEDKADAETAEILRDVLAVSQNIMYCFKSKRQITYKPKEPDAPFRHRLEWPQGWAQMQMQMHLKMLHLHLNATYQNVETFAFAFKCKPKYLHLHLSAQIQSAFDLNFKCRIKCSASVAVSC